MFEGEVVYITTSTNSWYNDLKYYLRHGSSLCHLYARKRRSLRLKYTQYQLINGVLFHKNYDNVLLRWFQPCSYRVTWWVGRNKFWWRVDCTQSTESRLLLAHTIQICTYLCKKVSNFPCKCSQGKKTYIPTSTSNNSKSLWTMGIRSNWWDQFKIF